jgi:hypothetical protein
MKTGRLSSFGAKGILSYALCKKRPLFGNNRASQTEEVLGVLERTYREDQGVEEPLRLPESYGANFLFGSFD